MTKIAIVGSMGYVGKSIASMFSYLKFERWEYDKAIHSADRKQSLNDWKPDVVFICVPTPQRENGACDTSAVEEVLEWVEAALIVIKSTVPPGFTRKFGMSKPVVFSPEFIGESTYDTGHAHSSNLAASPYFIFGGHPRLTSQCVDLYSSVCGPNRKYIQTDSDTAEMVKYMTNSFFATKVAFCNEISRVCGEVGIDYREVRELFTLNPMVNPMHTVVFKDRPGFGGKCLPKDLTALIRFAEDNGLDPLLLRAVHESNLVVQGLRP